MFNNNNNAFSKPANNQQNNPTSSNQQPTASFGTPLTSQNNPSSKYPINLANLFQNTQNKSSPNPFGGNQNTQNQPNKPAAFSNQTPGNSFLGKQPTP